MPDVAKLDKEKCVRYIRRVLVMLPRDREDASHAAVVYFCILSLALLDALNDTDRGDIDKYTQGLWVGCGYKASVSYLTKPENAHVPSTYFCLALRAMVNLPQLDAGDQSSVEAFLRRCQCSNGNFRATERGEASLRHAYSAHAAFRLMKLEDELTANTAEKPRPVWMRKAADYILTCQNYDGGIGDKPCDESHAALMYCGLACLNMSGDLARLRPGFQNYLAKRQNTSSGGFNGRPNKPDDVCYMFWTLAALDVTGHSLNGEAREAAIRFALGPGYDNLLGGFVKTKGESADPYHTALALCGLSILNYPGLRPLNTLFTLVPAGA